MTGNQEPDEHNNVDEGNNNNKSFNKDSFLLPTISKNDESFGINSHVIFKNSRIYYGPIAHIIGLFNALLRS